MSASMRNNRKSTSSDESLGEEILRAIRRILRKTAEYSRQLAREGGLSVPQLLCLRKVAESSRTDPVTVAEVAEAVQLSNATVSRILDRLEAAELVVRERSTTDRRKVLLWLTPQGKRRVRSLPTPLHDVFLERLRTLPPEEQRAMLASLQRIVRMMGAEEMDAAPILVPDADGRLAGGGSE